MRVPVVVWQPCELLYTCYLLTYWLLMGGYLLAVQNPTIVDGQCTSVRRRTETKHLFAFTETQL